MIRILEQDVKSQSPENGSQHCKDPGGPGRRPLAGAAGSQSPENGSQHCKPPVCPPHWRGPGSPVAIP